MNRPGLKLPTTIASRRGILALGVIVILLIWVCVVSKSVSDRQIASHDWSRTDESYALVSAESLARTIDEIDKSLLHMRRGLESPRGGDPSGVIAAAKDLLGDVVTQIAIIDADGILRAVDGGPRPPDPASLADRDQVRVYQDSAADILHISRPVPGRASVQFSRKFLTPEGAFGGVVVASLDSSHLARLPDAIDLDPETSVAVVGADGVVRSAIGRGLAVGRDVSDTGLGARVREDREGTFEDRMDDAGTRVVSLRKMRDQPLWIAVSVPRETVYRDANAKATVDVTVAIVLTALVAIGVGTLLRLKSRHSAAEDEVLRLAMRDPLTDLPNRRVFRAELEAVTATLTAGDEPSCAVLLFDLNRFKAVNDTLGHSVGDKLLTMMGRRLSGAMRPGQTLARIGGDEFAVVVRGFTGRVALDRLADRLCAAAARPFDIDGHVIRIGASVGVAIGPSDGLLADDLQIAADLALYAAKASKIGCCVYYDRAMSDGLSERRQLETELREALQAGRLHLHYQPSVNPSDGRITGFEALARWRHPVRGDIPPSVFIPIAEDSGLIHDLGLWALTEACRQATAWPADVRLAVNLSPTQFAGPDLLAVIATVLGETGLDPSRLELEITEQTLLDNGPRTVGILKSLKALGLGIAMDDFGTGYSSLNYLRDFPFDRIKVDRSFVAELGRGVQHSAIVRAVIDIAQSFGMVTTAEGVETAEQRDIIAKLGCDEIQGYFYSRPVPVADVARLIARADVGRQIAA